jgi:hypothetical protein
MTLSNLNHSRKTEISIGLGGKAGRRFTKPMAPENRQKYQYLSLTK